MDQNYLQQLITELKARDGGLILNLDGKPGAVVLSIEKYNLLLSNSNPQAGGQVPDPENQPSENPESSPFHPKTILITGGAGYIGAHVSRHLVNAGHSVIILDNLVSGTKDNLPSGAKFIEGDVGDFNLLRDIFASSKVDVVMHFAASIEVEESVKDPGKYLENNAVNTARLLAAMDEAGVKQIIFSSTAAVYGRQANQHQPILETASKTPENPYGHSKLIAEETISYYCRHKEFTAVVFRYFNACGSDFDGKIQTSHTSHLLAKLMQAVISRDTALTINGNDYSTHDGTAVRDYVHVLDIVGAHLVALGKLTELIGFNDYNIGTGKGCSVLEMAGAVAETLNKIVPMEPGPRRAGDAECAVADNSKIRQELGFIPQFSEMETIIKTAYRQAQNSRKAQ